MVNLYRRIRTLLQKLGHPREGYLVGTVAGAPNAVVLYAIGADGSREA